MMRKSFLLKTVFSFIALVVVLTVIIFTMHNKQGSAASGVVRTQTFFEQFVIAGGPIVWFVLLPMSLIMVYLAADHSFTIRRKKLLRAGAGAGIVEILEQFGPGQLEARIAGQDDFVSTAVVRAITQGRSDWFRMRNLLFESLQEQASALIRKIEWVNLIGNVSPMVGLFGTVFGMIKLFNAIVIAGGQPQPAQLADGISVALVTTFWGLFIAIPALTIHGVFRNRIEALLGDAIVEAENIMPQVKRCLAEQNPAEQVKRKQPISELRGKSAKTIGQPLPLR